jgi:hypothetical protein
MSPHAEEIIISSRGKRVTLGGARSTPSIDRACRTAYIGHIEVIGDPEKG